MPDVILPSDRTPVVLPSDRPAAVPAYDPALYSQDPDQIFPIPQVNLPSDVRAAADAIENKYQYVVQRYGDSADNVAKAGAKREQEMQDLMAKAKAAKIPFGEIKPGSEVVEDALAKETQAAKMTPEDVQALLPGKLPGGIVPPPGLAAKAIAPVESGVATTAGGVANPENMLYAGTGEAMIPGFVAQQVVQGAANIVGGAKKIFTGQPGGGEQIVEGGLGLGMAAAPMALAKVLPARAASATAATETARPADDWLPPAPKAPPASEVPATVPVEAPAPAEAGAPRQGTVAETGGSATGVQAAPQAAPAPAVAAEPAAIPVGDEKAADAGTPAAENEPQNPGVGTAGGVEKTSPGANGEVENEAAAPKTAETAKSEPASATSERVDGGSATGSEANATPAIPAGYQPPPLEGTHPMVAAASGEPLKGTNAQWLESNLGDLKQDMPGAPAAKVVQSIKDLPAQARTWAQARAAEGLRVKGMLAEDGNIYLIADHLADVNEARETFLHEAFGHAGMSAALKPSDIEPLYQLIWQADPTKAAAISQLYRHALGSARGRADFVDEFVASASHEFHQRPGPFRRLVSAVYRALYRVPLLRRIAPARVLDAMLQGLAMKARARLANPGAELATALRRSDSSGPRNNLSTGSNTPQGPRFSLAANDDTGTRQFAEQLQDATDISDALKGSVTNTTYTRRPQEDDATYANRIMSDVGGPDHARAVFSDRSRLPSSVRMALGMQILKAYDAAGRHADAASFFDNDFAQHTTDTAQGLAMLNAWHSMSKDGKIVWARKKISDAGRDMAAPVQPDIDAAKTELQRQNGSGIEKTTAEPGVQAAAKEAVTNAVENSKATHAGVVMELTQPWASSPEILGMVRDAVGKEIEEKATRSNGGSLTGAVRQQFKADLDGLAKRAAGIASGHYQGAEPGVTLRDKLQQRLGLSKDAAGRLANSLDKEFERQVNAAKNRVPKRVARQVERARNGPANMRLARSIPDREAEAAAKNLADAASSATGQAGRPALQEFYQRLTAQLRQLLPDQGAGAGKPKLTDLQRIAEAFSNPEKFDEVWQRLGTELRAKYGIEGIADLQNTLGRLTPEALMETQLDRSIRQQLTEAKVKLGQLVREHYTKVDATKAELADKLVKQAGLDGEAAQKLAAAVKSRFEALTAATKRAALERLLKPVKRLGLAKPQLVDRLVQLSNIGAFDDPTFYNAIRERMNLPEWTPALRDQLSGIADKIGKIPADQVEAAQRAQTEFLNAIERAKGISNLELGLAFYMQNILSGLTTHVRVAVHTSSQMAAATTAEMARALAGGRLEDVALIVEALARGGGRALNQMKDIFQSGTVVGSKVKQAAPLSVMEQIRFGQKGGTTFRQGAIAKAVLENRAATVLNLWKYNARLITAQHMLYYAPAEEMKVALLASRQARTEGLTGRAAVDRARQILGYGAAAVRSAEAQAIREGLEGTRAKMRTAEILKASVPAAMKETARDYALRQTFLSEPYGFIGAVANSVANMKASENVMLATAARVIVPFTRIAANVFNEGLNYTPYGALRAKGWNFGAGGLFDRTQVLGQKFADITPEVRSDLQRELYAKSALGSMLLTAIAFKAAQGLSQPNPGFTVYGQGPNNPQDQAAWRAAGGIPFSIKVGNRYLSYANTPANVMLAALGNYLDGLRDAALYKRPGAERLAQNLPMRLAASTVGMARVVLEQPFLQALVEMFKTSSEPNPEVAGRGAAKIVARTASSFVVPNLLRQLDRFKDPTAYSQQDLSGILTSQVPFVRQAGRPMLNALGQPLKSPVFGLFTGTRTEDPLVKTLVDHNAWPQLPDRNRTTVNGVPLTDDEFYAYCQERGRALTAMLSKPAVAAELDRLAQQRAAIQASVPAAPNPIARARLQQLAAGIQNRVMEKYEAAADKQAAAAVMRIRGY